jgi:tryptophanyl-tRNA synthetase
MVDPAKDTIKTEQPEEQKEDVVTAFNISAASDKGIDYEKLTRDFGCFDMTQELITRIEKATGKPCHRFIRRNIFFCQRDLEEILKAYEA